MSFQSNSAAKAFLQERGELEECQALPGDAYTSHPLWEEVCSALQFRQFGKIVRVGRRRHINVGEVRAAIRGEEGVGRRYPGSRYIHLQDSQVSLATFVKGRSSSRAINFELRRSLPCYLASRVRPSFGFIRSKLNPSDDPTRSCELREPSREPSDWFASALQGNFSSLDTFLYEQELHPEQLAGLPDPRELSSDGPLAEVLPAKHRRARVTHDPERRARQILRHESISIEIFRRLPKEISSRSSGLRGNEASFSAGVFVHGGVVGLRKNCELFPAAVQVLTGFLRSIRPGFVFSSLAVNQNIRTLPHFDRNNLSTEPNLVVALSRFRRGGIWIETLGGSVEVAHRNQVKVGEVLDVASHPVLVDARRLHCTMGWRGSRIVLIGFTVRGTEKLSSVQRAEALSLGFVLPPEGSSGESTLVSEYLPQDPRVVRPPRSKPLPVGGISARRSHRPWRIDPFHFSVGSPGVEPAFTASSSQPCISDRVDSLPSAVLQVLRSMPPGRFVFSSAFPDLDSALCSGSGWLDLFSGMRGFARALAAAAPCWILCLDVSHGDDEDLLDPDLQGTIFELVRGGAFAGISAAPVCASFSSAIVPTWRSREHPQGKPGLRLDQVEKVVKGNSFLEFILELIVVCGEVDAIYWIENPATSWFWRQPAWSSVLGHASAFDFKCDFCAFGTPWRKSTIFRTNGQLRGKRLLCPRTHVHRVLRGRDPSSGVSWTKLAEPYPKRLCNMLAAACASDVGWLGEHRDLDLNRCAKFTGARIGEASHPGPRKPRRHRAPQLLVDIPVVAANTAKLREGIWARFRSWIHEGVDEGLWNGAPSSSLSCSRVMAKCFTSEELLYRNSANCWRMLNMSSLVYDTAFGQRGTCCPSGRGLHLLNIGFLCRSQSSLL